MKMKMKMKMKKSIWINPFWLWILVIGFGSFVGFCYIVVDVAVMGVWFSWFGFWNLDSVVVFVCV